MRSLILSAILAAPQLSSVAIAGCGESEGRCYYYEQGTMRSDAPCQIAVCSNINETFYNWRWDNGNEVVIRFEGDGLSVNGQPGFNLALPGVEHLTCYGIEGTDELLCSEEQ